jgi:hypothetical protein
MKFSQCGTLQEQKPSSAMMKLAFMRTATGKEDPEFPLLQRIHSLELTAPQINVVKSLSNRHISTSAVQRRLRKSGLHGQSAEKKPLLKDTNNNNKRLSLAKKHKRKSVLWSDDRLVFVRHRVDEWIISAYEVPTVKHGGGSVMVWRCFAGDTFSEFKVP